jgi:hypothetical protein
MPDEKPTIPVHALDQPDYREVLRHADVIIAVDVMTRQETVVHGVDALRRALETDTTDQIVAAFVELDVQTNELPWLRSIVQEITRPPDKP